MADFERMNKTIPFVLLFDLLFSNFQHPYPRRKIDQSGTVYKVGSILTIANVTMQDGGMYTCKTFNVTRLEANVTVTVYGKFCS